MRFSKDLSICRGIKDKHTHLIRLVDLLLEPSERHGCASLLPGSTTKIPALSNCNKREKKKKNETVTHTDANKFPRREEKQNAMEKQNFRNLWSAALAGCQGEWMIFNRSPLFSNIMTRRWCNSRVMLWAADRRRRRKRKKRRWRWPLRVYARYDLIYAWSHILQRVPPTRPFKRL